MYYVTGMLGLFILTDIQKDTHLNKTNMMFNLIIGKHVCE